LVAFPVAFFVAPTSPSTESVLLRLGAPNSLHREKSRLNGLLLTFFSELPAARISIPPNYSAAAVARSLSKYSVAQPQTIGPDSREGVNLIVYLVESLMDPDDLGLHFSSDPVPNLRAVREAGGPKSGIVPHEFGGSANTEFEALTGMAMSLLPVGSVPFKQYLWRPIPSLPATLRESGYATIAIQADPQYFYNRERAYHLLGFEKVLWLHEAPAVEWDARGKGRVSDAAVVKAVIEVSRQRHPFFAFAFPSATHSPYNFGTYKSSGLDVVGGSGSQAAAEVKEYVNALRVADQAIGTLIKYFRGRPEPTIIVILGDHLPPLSSSALQSFSTRLDRLPPGDQALMTRRVPLTVWANFDLPRGSVEMSVNALPAYLLEKLKVTPPAFLALTQRVHYRIPVLADYCRDADGRVWRLDSLPADERAMVEAHRLLQYDLLFGKQYSLRPQHQE
jgi:phosphoglycerol transferase MdoB-like AlkP superfamily enzyme